MKARAMTLDLRAVDPARDANALATIYAPYVLETFVSFEEVPPSPAEMQARAVAVLEEGLPYLVAEDTASGRVMGYAYASPYRPRTAYRYAVESSIYVHPQAQSQGLGRRLMDAVTLACQKQGMKTMLAVASLDPDIAVDENPSVRFHRSYGFTEVGFLIDIGKKFDKWAPTVLFQLSLDQQG